MSRKSAEELIEELAIVVGKGFKHVDERLDWIDQRIDKLDQRLDRIEYLVAGQERRIEILEDRVRQLSTKIGLQFN